MISIDDVTKIDEKRKQIRKEIYKKIYEQFSSKIKQSVELVINNSFWEFLFLVGYPVFDRSAAARYVARQFILGGFTVQLVSDCDLYISWIIPKKKKDKRESEEDAEFPNLMNLKKMANKYRRSA